MADKIPRHYSGTWTGKINRDPTTPDFVHHKDHPNSSTNQLAPKPEGKPKSTDDLVDAYDAEMTGKL